MDASHSVFFSYLTHIFDVSSDLENRLWTDAEFIGTHVGYLVHAQSLASHKLFT